MSTTETNKKFCAHLMSWTSSYFLQKLQVFEMSGAFQTHVSLYNASLFYIVTMLMLIFQSWKKNFFKFKLSNPNVKYNKKKKRVSAYQMAFSAESLEVWISLLDNWRRSDSFLGVRIRSRRWGGSTTAAAHGTTTTDHHGAPAHSASRRLHFWMHFSDHIIHIYMQL